jgi:response regulator NasT
VPAQDGFLLKPEGRDVTTQPLHIAVAEDERDTRDPLQELLTRLGHEAVAVTTGKQLVELCAASPPDLIITDVKMPDMDGITVATEVNKGHEIPVILVSDHLDTELLARAAAAGPVMAYLVKPVREADVQAAVPVALARFRQYLGVRSEADSLRQALEDRKVVERAKGTVMKRLGVGEEEAFRRLRGFARSRNRRLAEVARDVLGAEELFRQAKGV